MSVVEIVVAVITSGPAYILALQAVRKDQRERQQAAHEHSESRGAQTPSEEHDVWALAA